MTPRTTKLLISAAALVGLVVALATPGALGSRLGEALETVRGANAAWLAVGTLGFAAGFLACVCAWRAALAATGAEVSLRHGASSIGVGALVNTVVPARLGDAVKIGLFARGIDGTDRMWTAGGVYASVAASRCLVIAGLVVVASATGALPLWPVFALCGGVAVFGAVALWSPRWRRYHHVARLLSGFAALERSPRAGAKVLAWSAATALCRLAAIAALAIALGLPHALLVALAIGPALDLAGTLPLTPGNLGVASGAVAMALHSRGIGVTHGLGVGIAIQTLETLVSLAAGTAGALYLFGAGGRADRWAPRVAAIGLAGVLAALLGTVVYGLT
jgi:uncharacterized membrane protein YbhN (UPF0104 family)